MTFHLISSKTARNWSPFALCCGLFAVTACGETGPGTGTDTGNPYEPGGGGDEGPQIELVDDDCSEATPTERSVEWDEPVLGILTGELLFENLPESSQETLRWIDEAGGQPLGSETELSVVLRPLGTATLIAPKETQSDEPRDDGPVDDGPMMVEPIATTCTARLRIDVEFEISTADGTLDETFVTQMDSDHPDLANTRFRIPLAELDGSLGEVPGFDLLEVHLTYSRVGMLGRLSLLNSSDAEALPLEIATFPANQPCGDEAFLLEGSDTLFGFSPANLHGSFDQVREVTWQLEHEPGTIDVACEVDLPETLCVGSSGAREYLTTVTLTSSDGSLDGSFQVNVHALGGSDGTFSELGMAGGRYAQDLTSAAGIGEEYALTDPAPLDGYMGAMTDFIVYVSDEPWGVFRYQGLTQDDCSVPEEGCEGLVPTTLFGMHFGEPKLGYELEPEQ